MLEGGSLKDSMTTIRKPYHRVTNGAYRVLLPSCPRQIVVSLEPGDIIIFREKGRRKRYSYPIDSAFTQAVRNAAAAKRRLARERRAA